MKLLNLTSQYTQVRICIEMDIQTHIHTHTGTCMYVYMQKYIEDWAECEEIELNIADGGLQTEMNKAIQVVSF